MLLTALTFGVTGLLAQSSEKLSLVQGRLQDLQRPDIGSITWYPVIKEGKLSYIDSAGNLLLDPFAPRANSFELRAVRSNLFAIPVEGKSLVISRNPLKVWDDRLFEDVVIDVDDAVVCYALASEDDEEEFLLTLSDEVWGIYDFNHKEILPAQYSLPYLSTHELYNGLWFIENNKLQGAINLKGETVIPVKYAYLGSVHQGLMAYSLPNMDLYGYVNTSGKEVIPAQFTTAGPFSDNGLAIVRYKSGEGISIIDRGGKTIKRNIPIVAHGGLLQGAKFTNGWCLVEDTLKAKYGFMDGSGQLSIPLKYTFAEGYTDGYAIGNYGGIKDKEKIFKTFMGGKWVVINKQGKEMFPPMELTALRHMGSGMFSFRQQDKWGIMDATGRVIVPANFLQPPGYFDGPLARLTEESTEKGSVFKYDKIGYINKAGKIVWPISE